MKTVTFETREDGDWAAWTNDDDSMGFTSIARMKGSDMWALIESPYKNWRAEKIAETKAKAPKMAEKAPVHGKRK